MAGDTKERILETALELFAQNGYLGTSMNDIAGQLGFTKAALYKHYASKQEILDKIVERMNKMDYERAEAYEMPETEPDGFAEAYLHTPIQKIRTYSLAQFDHWTKEPFSSNFRKMLTLEQYRDPKLAQLHHDYLAGGPLEYMAAIFRKLADSDEDGQGSWRSRGMVDEREGGARASCGRVVLRRTHAVHLQAGWAECCLRRSDEPELRGNKGRLRALRRRRPGPHLLADGAGYPPFRGVLEGSCS